MREETTESTATSFDPILDWLARQPQPEQEEQAWQKACRLIDAFCAHPFIFQRDFNAHLQDGYSSHCVAHYSARHAWSALECAQLADDSYEMAIHHIQLNDGIPAGLSGLNIPDHEKCALLAELHVEDNDLIARAIKNNTQAGMDVLYRFISQGFG